ncbi:MAG: hypothetical protein WC748_09915 [Legionellales bacterium]|jgi:hypothetical protein
MSTFKDFTDYKIYHDGTWESVIYKGVIYFNNIPNNKYFYRDTMKSFNNLEGKKIFNMYHDLLKYEKLISSDEV